MNKPARLGSTRTIAILSASLALSVISFWGEFIRLASMGGGFVFVPLFLVIVSNQCFVAYHLLAELQTCPQWTGSLDTFFYENRCGSVVLAMLCIIWFVAVWFVGIYVLLGVLEFTRHLDAPEHSQLASIVENRVAIVAIGLVWIMTLAMLLVGVFWLSYTLKKAMYGIGCISARPRYPRRRIDIRLDEHIFSRR